MSAQRKRTLGTLSFVLATTLVAAGTAAGSFFLVKARKAKTDLAEFIVAHPESVGVVVTTVDEDGAAVADGYDLARGAGQRLVLASTVKIAVHAAYADAVASGQWAADQAISVAEWERFYLPATDGGAHRSALAALGIQADEQGFARDPSATVAVADVARAMIHTSDNAATDYLVARLGRDLVAAVMEQAGLREHGVMVSLLGVALTLVNQDQPPMSAGALRGLVAQVAAGDASQLDRLAERYLNDPEWRAGQIASLTSAATSAGVDAEERWGFQVQGSHLLPAGTAQEYARMMALIASGRLISPEVSAIMRQVLETAPADEPLRVLFYDRYGTKDGLTAGVTTIASYAVPKRGALAGQQRVVVILLNDLPPDLWRDVVRYQGLYLLQADLAQAKGVFNQLRGVVASGDEIRIVRRRVPKGETGGVNHPWQVHSSRPPSFQLPNIWLPAVLRTKLRSRRSNSPRSRHASSIYPVRTRR